MKKLLLIVAFLVCAFMGYAQGNGSYGIRAGINISNLDFDPAPRFDNTHRNGFAFGFFAEYDLSASLAIMPEFQYSSEGAKDKSIRVDFLQVPILFKYRITDMLSAGVGPQVGVKIHEEEDGFKNFAFSGIVGLEYMITEEIFVDARYSYGLTNLLDETTGFKATDSNLQFGVGYKM